MNTLFARLFAFSVFTLLIPQIASAELVITFGGDFSLNQNGQETRADATRVRGKWIQWDELMAGIIPLWDGDLNFANLETVVSDNPKIPGSPKKFQFRSHPEGVKYAASKGLNLFSLANNHAYDFGEAGLIESLKALEKIQNHESITCAGAGMNREEALDVKIIELKGYRIAFAAVGITTQPGQKADSSRAGNAAFRDKGHYYEVLDRLALADVDFRILSIHSGAEGQVRLDPNQRKEYHEGITRGKADLILGHHPHVVRPAEKVGNTLIFYSLGNYLITGARDITGESDSKDYGLFGRVFLNKDPSGKVVIEAVEVVPLTQMHASSKPMNQDDTQRRLKVINQLGEEELGVQNGLRFDYHRESNSGVNCLESISRGSRASHLCAESKTKQQ